MSGKCPNCGFDLPKVAKAKCREIVQTPWSSQSKSRNCTFSAVEHGYCKRHSLTTRLAIMNRKIKRLREIIVEGTALLAYFQKGERGGV